MKNLKEKYYKKNPSEFETFSEKITCARVNFINGRRNTRGLTLVKAAKKIGITGMYLSYLENGSRKSPDAVIVRTMEKVYGFKPGELSELLLNESMSEVV